MSTANLQVSGTSTETFVVVEMEGWTFVAAEMEGWKTSRNGRMEDRR
jgi:hypothetical protein